MKSQNKIIAEYLQAGNSIDPLMAQTICGTMNLAQRIADLRKAPYCLDIEPEIVKSKGSYHCKYKLIKVNEQPLGFWRRVLNKAAIC